MNSYEGYASAFWLDWFTYGLVVTGSPNGIAALVSAHERGANRPTTVLHVDDELYVTDPSSSP